MAWSKGDPWRVVESLQRLNAQIRAAHPAAIPPATPATAWGSIADDAHATTSDHYPHTYAALGAVAVVCARDFPHAPQLGLDAHAIAEAIRASRDARVAYVISNRRITGPNHGWRWDTYGGSDPHDTHIHVSTVHTAAADDARDWEIGEDMTPEQAKKLDDLHAAFCTPRPWAPGRTTARFLDDMAWAWLYSKRGVEGTWFYGQFRAVLEAIKTVPGIDGARVDAIEAELVAAVRQANADAVADALQAGADAARDA